jgi:glycosyltransferase involved in cell wall biosynthesis
VIVVDDGSTDETVEALAGLDVTMLRNDQNRGKADSLWRGFQEALAQGAVAVITLDADGQHAPEQIPSFIAAALRAPEAFVIGARRVEQRISSRCRYVANRVADFWISWAAGRPIEDSQSGFRLYPAPFLRNLTLKHGLKQSFVFESEVLIEAGRRDLECLHIPINIMPRMGPRGSHFRPIMDILRITRMVARRIISCRSYTHALAQTSIRRRAIDVPRR